ncbi:MAG: OsmC family protein [Thermoleophilaceae bacterium]
MSLRATARSSGDTLRQQILIDGRHELVTDEPERLGGTDAGPAPHELFPAALAGCVATTIRTYARAKGWQISDIEVDVVYDNQSTPRRFDVTITLPPGLAPEQRERIERVAAACPLRRAIEAGFEFHEELVSQIAADAEEER